MNITHKSTYVLCSISVLVLCLSVAGPGAAQVPKKLNYQGYLQDSLTGEPVTGTMQMEFALYDVPTGGSPLWSEAQQVEVNEGSYSVHLGAVTPLNLTEARSYYLGVHIDGEVLVNDSGVEYREELTSGLYTLFSDTTEYIDLPIRLWPNPEYIDENTFYGVGAGDNTTGKQNTFIGHEAGLWNETGGSNTFVGDDAGRANTIGSFNTFLGYNAGVVNTNSSSNTFVGSKAGEKNEEGHHNTFVGFCAGWGNMEGHHNTLIGNKAGLDNMDGHSNTFVGNETGGKNYSGSENTFVGNQAGWKNSFGHYNTFLGNEAGYNNTFGCRNTYVGWYVGRANEEGSGNVFLGYMAGCLETGANKLYINNSCSETPLIYGTFGDYTSVGLVRIHGDLQHTGNLSHVSDQRLKDIQQAFTSGLEVIEHIQPVSYRYKAENPLNLSPDRDYVGVLAQEVQQVIPEAVEEGENGYLMVNNDPIIWTMLNAIKELKAQNEALKARDDALKAQNEMMKKEIELLKEALGQ